MQPVLKAYVTSLQGRAPNEHVQALMTIFSAVCCSTAVSCKQ